MQNVNGRIATIQITKIPSFFLIIFRLLLPLFELMIPYRITKWFKGPIPFNNEFDTPRKQDANLCKTEQTLLSILIFKIPC